MSRLLSCLIAAGLAAGIAACDRKEFTPPLPKMDTSAVKQKAGELAGAVESAAKKEKDEFLARVQGDVQESKAKIGELRARITTAAGKAKSTLEERVAVLEEEQKIAEQKVTDLNAATAEKWKDLQQGVGAAIDRLKQSVQKAQKDTA